MSQLEGKEANFAPGSPLHAEHLKEERHSCNECLRMYSYPRSVTIDIGIPHTDKTGCLCNVRTKVSQSQCNAHQQEAPNAPDQKFKVQGNLSAEKAGAENAGNNSQIPSSACHPPFQYQPPDPRAHRTIVLRGGFWEPPAKPRPPEWDDDEETRKLKVWREFQKALNEIRVEAVEKQRKMEEQEGAASERRLMSD